MRECAEFCMESSGGSAGSRQMGSTVEAHLPGRRYAEHNTSNDIPLLVRDPLEQRLIVALLDLL